MAASSRSVEEKLSRIRDVLGSLSSSQAKLEGALQDLAEILLLFAKRSEDEGRNLCFSLGIVKAILGILRSSSKRAKGQAAMVAKAARCLALLAHSNEEAKIRLGEMGAVTSLVQLLQRHPRITASGSNGAGSTSAAPELGGNWPLEWMEVYEQALVGLRKLTYHNDCNQQELARVGGVKLVIEIAMDESLMSNFGNFGPKAKTCLEDLVLRKKMISRVVAVPDKEKVKLFQSFPSIVTVQYPAYYLDLVDQNGTWISSSMIERGVVWPAPSPTPSDARWTCVMVQNVEDGCHVWCQFCTQKPNPAIAKMRDTLMELSPPSPGDVGVADPLVGDVYAAFCAPPTGHTHSLWMRSRVIALSKESVQVLAVDYGYTLSVPSSFLRPLPQQCRGISPQLLSVPCQPWFSKLRTSDIRELISRCIHSARESGFRLVAIPCMLRGVQPLPASVGLLENAAAVIRNMAFETLAFRKEIRIFKGIEAMVKLAGSPSKAVILQALGALLNITVTEALREDVGKRGAVQVALNLVECCSEEGEVLEHAVGLLLNLCSFCTSNVALMAKLRGQAVLTGLCVSGKVEEDQRGRIEEMTQRLIHFLLCHDSKGAVSVSSRTEESSKTTKSSSPKKNALFRARQLANGERGHSRPVVRYSRHHPPIPKSSHASAAAHNESESSSSSADDRGQSADASVRSVRSARSSEGVFLHASVFGRVREGGGTMARCVFYRAEDISEFTTASLKRAVCGVLNTQEAWSIFLGVNSTGKVKGCKITKRQRDLLCIGVDGLMRGLTPPVMEGYTVTFLPVLPRCSTWPSPEGNNLEDVYIVELKVKGLGYNQIYTISEKDAEGFKYNRCYYRQSAFTVRLSYQELRDVVAKKEAESCSEAVTKIKKDITDLRG